MIQEMTSEKLKMKGNGVNYVSSARIVTEDIEQNRGCSLLLSVPLVPVLRSRDSATIVAFLILISCLCGSTAGSSRSISDDLRYGADWKRYLARN